MNNEYWLDLIEYYKDLRANNFRKMIQKAKIFKNKLKAIDTTELLVIEGKEDIIDRTDKSKSVKLFLTHECIEPIKKTEEWQSLKETERKLYNIVNSTESYKVSLVFSPMVEDFIVNIDKNTTLDIKRVINKLFLPDNEQIVKILLKNKDIPLDFTLRVSFSPRKESWDDLRTLLQDREKQRKAVFKMENYLEIKQKKKVDKWLKENNISFKTK